MPKAISIGEPLIDMFALPVGVPLKQATSLVPAPGGAPANVAVALARLGVQVGFIGAAGKDPFGDWLVEIMQLEGVDTTLFLQVPDKPTTLAIVATKTPEEQDFMFYRGADAELTIEALDRTYISSARVLLYGSITLTDSSRQACLQAAEWAKQAQALVIFDANLRPFLWRSLDAARDEILASVRKADVCKLNEIELELLAGTDDLATGSRRILAQGPRLVLITLGSHGAYYNNGHAQGLVPGFQVSAVDTTGCGDAFVAGLVCDLLEANCPPEELDRGSLRRMVCFANAVGALTATAKGAMAALPTRGTVEAFLARYMADSDSIEGD